MARRPALIHLSSLRVRLSTVALAVVKVSLRRCGQRAAIARAIVVKMLSAKRTAQELQLLSVSVQPSSPLSSTSEVNNSHSWRGALHSLTYPPPPNELLIIIDGSCVSDKASSSLSFFSLIRPFILIHFISSFPKQVLSNSMQICDVETYGGEEVQAPLQRNVLRLLYVGLQKELDEYA